VKRLPLILFADAATVAHYRDRLDRAATLLRVPPRGPVFEDDEPEGEPQTWNDYAECVADGYA